HLEARIEVRAVGPVVATTRLSPCESTPHGGLGDHEPGSEVDELGEVRPAFRARPHIDVGDGVAEVVEPGDPVSETLLVAGDATALPHEIPQRPLERAGELGPWTQHGVELVA